MENWKAKDRRSGAVGKKPTPNDQETMKLPAGFEYIKKFKKAVIVKNSHGQLGIGVIDPQNNEKMFLVPLVDRYHLPLKESSVKGTRVCHAIIDECYKDLQSIFLPA